MRKILLSFASLIWASAALADADTMECLTTWEGQNRVTISGDQGFTEYNNFTLPDNSVVDARTAIFRQKTYPTLVSDYVLSLATNPDVVDVCVVGATQIGDNSETISWSQSHSNNHAFPLVRDSDYVMDGIRSHNGGDGPRMRISFYNTLVLKDSWLSYHRDDCIENDGQHPLRVEDSLFEGCYVFLSTRDSNSSNEDSACNDFHTAPCHVYLDNNIIALGDGDTHEDTGNGIFRRDGVFGGQRQPEKASSSEWGWGKIIKGGDYTQWRLHVTNNIFLVPDCPYVSGSKTCDGTGAFHMGFGHAQGHVVECSNNIIVWLGSGPYPGDIPNDPSCVVVTTDQEVYENARDQWRLDHPEVPRIDAIDGDEPSPPIPPTPGYVPVDLEDLIFETTTSSSTGQLTLVSRESDGWRRFSDAYGTAADSSCGSNRFFYHVRHTTTLEWEVGIGCMTDASTLVRHTVMRSSNSNATVAFSAGTKYVTSDLPADRQIFSGVLLGLSSDLSVGSSSLTTVSWQTVAEEVDEWWDASAPTDICVPDGVNRVYAQVGVRWASSGTGTRYVRVVKNGSEFAGTPQTQGTPGGSGSEIQVASVYPIAMAAGDCLQVQVWQDSGASLSVDAGNATYFGVLAAE